jgi:hypothetical protein
MLCNPSSFNPVNIDPFSSNLASGWLDAHPLAKVGATTCHARNDIVTLCKDVFEVNGEVRERHPNSLRMRPHYFGPAVTFCSIVIHAISGNEAV